MKLLAAMAEAIPTEALDERAGPYEAARRGDAGAFEAVLRQHERLVLATAYRLLGDREEAKDASQEVFLKLYRNLGKLRAEKNIPAWLYAVTVNVCRDMGKKRPVSAEPQALEERADGAPDPHQTLGADERRRALQLSLRALSSREREAVVLRDLEGLSTAEAARAMGASEATVRSHACQARIKMRSFLERYFRRRS